MSRYAFALCLLVACGPADEPSPPEAPPPPEVEAWSYDMLRDEERAVIDRDIAAAGWDRIQEGFANAVREQAATAPAEGAP
jgi:hypothetical protein